MFGRFENGSTGYLLFYISFLVEFSRLLLGPLYFFLFSLLFAGSYFSHPSDELHEILQERTKLHIELSNIKSIQLQFVQHSKLSRQIISLDKKITKHRENQSHSLTKLKHAFLLIRVNILYFSSYLSSFFRLGGNLWSSVSILWFPTPSSHDRSIFSNFIFFSLS